jgi:hypothetical protein
MFSGPITTGGNEAWSSEAAPPPHPPSAALVSINPASTCVPSRAVMCLSPAVKWNDRIVGLNAALE